MVRLGFWDTNSLSASPHVGSAPSSSTIHLEAGQPGTPPRSAIVLNHTQDPLPSPLSTHQQHLPVVSPLPSLSVSLHFEFAPSSKQLHYIMNVTLLFWTAHLVFLITRRQWV